MKTTKQMSSLLRTCYSAFLFVMFIIFVTGCEEPEGEGIVNTDYLGEGIYQRTFISPDYKSVTTSHRNQNGEITGLCKIKTYIFGYDSWLLKDYEIAYFVDGERHGKSIHYSPEDTTKIKSIDLYDKGRMIPFEKAAIIILTGPSAYDILKQKYPWFCNEIMGSVGRESVLKAYMDTIDMQLGKRTVDELKFINSYNSVLTEINKKPEFDTIHNVISSFTKLNFPGILQRDPFRLAVIDHYRSGKTIFSCIETTYPGYLKTINDKKITNSDFQGFCRVVDSLMISQGALNLNDPLFLDSVDTRLYRAINYLYSATKSARIGFTLNDVLNEGRYILAEAGIVNKPEWITSTPHDVSKVVVNIIYAEISEADLVYFAVREAYFTGKNWVLLPTVTTGFSNSNSLTSVTIRGNVIETGGANVTARGIAFAATYDPTTADKTVSSGSGTGEFLATITGLSAGVTYYARAYATNSKGTAYGNIISFNTTTTPVVDFSEVTSTDLTVFPNPASNSATFSFRNPSIAEYQLTIVDMKGQRLFSTTISNTAPGEFRKTISLAKLPDGVYSCMVTNGKNRSECRLLVKH